MSLDDENWVNIPLYNELPDLTLYDKNYAYLGIIDLNSYSVKIYVEMLMDENDPVYNSFLTQDLTDARVHFERVRSPKDKMYRILVALTLFGASLRVLDMIFLREH